MHIAAATALYLGMVPTAQAAEGCAVFMGDIRFCHAEIGLEMAVQDDLLGGAFLQEADPEDTIVYVYVSGTGRMATQTPESVLEEINSAYLADADSVTETRKVLEARVIDATPVPVMRTLRYRFSVDYGQVVAMTLVEVDGLTATILTVQGGVGEVFTDAHRTRHEAALSALRIPRTDPGCFALYEGQQICTAGTPWADFPPIYVDQILTMVDPDDPARDMLVAVTGPASPSRSFAGEEIASFNRQLAQADMPEITFSAETETQVAGRTWQVADFAARTSEGTQHIGRSSTAIDGPLFVSLRTSRRGETADPLPEDQISVHQNLRAAMNPRPSGDDGWIGLELKD